MRNNQRGSVKVVALAGLLGIIGACSVIPHFDRDVYTATVTEKPIKSYNESDKYLVFTRLEDGSIKVFKNTDSPLELKFNSSDIRAKLEIDKRYKIKTYGSNVPIFSGYGNIVSVESVRE